jgi:hypothetical protein
MQKGYDTDSMIKKGTCGMDRFDSSTVHEIMNEWLSRLEKDVENLAFNYC